MVSEKEFTDAIMGYSIMYPQSTVVEQELKEMSDEEVMKWAKVYWDYLDAARRAFPQFFK